MHLNLNEKLFLFIQLANGKKSEGVNDDLGYGKTPIQDCYFLQNI